MTLKYDFQEVVEEKNADELGLDNVGGVFLVLGVGVGMSFGFAVLEFLWNVRQVSVEEHVNIKKKLSNTICTILY